MTNEERDQKINETINQVSKLREERKTFNIRFEMLERKQDIVDTLNDAVIIMSTKLDNLIANLDGKKSDWKWLVAMGLALLPTFWNIIQAALKGAKP